MASSRETVRDAFVALVTTAMVGSGKALQAVYGYRVSDFQGQSPVMVVSSEGTYRQRMTALGSRATFWLDVDWFVLYNDLGTWTEANAEDKLDEIEQDLAELLDANQRTAQWEALDYDERSSRLTVEVGGVQYAWERVVVKVEVFG